MLILLQTILPRLIGDDDDRNLFREVVKPPVESTFLSNKKNAALLITLT